MKPSLSILSFLVAGFLVLATTPRALAQQPGDGQTPVDTPLVHTPPAPQRNAVPTEEPDVFDALKKGITKVQKQAKEAKEIEPQLKALKKQQDATQQELIEGKERLHAVLTHQAEEIKSLQTTVERLETELKSLKAAAPSPTPASTVQPVQP